MQIQLKNELMHAICAFEAKRSNWPNLGRKRKLTTADILDRIVFVCRTGCQWSQLPVACRQNVLRVHRTAYVSIFSCINGVFYTMETVEPTRTTDLDASGIHFALEWRTQ